MDQSALLTRTWKILWKHKMLYLIGLAHIMVFFLPSLIFTIFTLTSLDWLKHWVINGVESLQDLPVYGWILIGLALLIGFALYLYLALSFRAALLQGAWLAETDETGTFSFSQLWSLGQSRVLRLILLPLLVWGVFGIGWVVAVPALVVALELEMYWMFCLVLPLIIIMGIVMMILQIISQMGNAGIVGENLGVIAALKRAWNLAGQNKVSVGLLMVLLTVINYGVSMVIQTPPSILTGLLPSFGSGSDTMDIILIITLVTILVSVLYAGVFTSFNDTAWIVAFRRLSHPPEPIGAEAHAEQSNPTTGEPLVVLD
jgi:hypothetical protein